MILMSRKGRDATAAERAGPGGRGAGERMTAPATDRPAKPRRRSAVSGLLASIAGRCGDMVSLIAALDRLRRVGVNLNRSLRLARLQGSPLTSEETGLVRECLELVDRMRARKEPERAVVNHG